MSIGLRPIFIILFSLVSIITSVIFVSTITVHAVELPPSCSSGGIYGDGISTTFTIKLICTDAVKFAHSGSSVADSVDLTKIIYQPNGSGFNPHSAVISGNEMSLILYAEYGSYDRDVSLLADLLLNSSNQANIQTLIPTANISDFNLPVIEPDYYLVSSGYVFNASAAQGVLNNDFDAESVVGNVELVDGPNFGSLTLNADGSFTYSPSPDYPGIDYFSYLAKDSSGSSNIAVVTLADEAPKVSANLYNKTVIGSNYAKVGDVIRLDFEISEPISGVNISRIAKNQIEPQKIDDTHFYIEYTMQDSDIEGPISYAIEVVDSVGNLGSSNSSDGIIFDMTSPIIDLVSSSEQDMDLYDFSYVERAVVTDNSTDSIDLVVSGSYNPSRAGSYVLVYNAVDAAGNHASTVTRTINVIDRIAVYYSEISDDLISLGLFNNLDQVNADNYQFFPGLYIEKYIDDMKIGRVTFNNIIDLSGNMEAFLYELADRLEADTIGSIGINMADATIGIDYGSLGATIKFYNLDKLGYANYSTKDDVYGAIVAFDDNGDLIDKSALDYESALFVGCGPMMIECYTFEIRVSHFSKYVIGRNIVNPPVEPSKPAEGSGANNELQPQNVVLLIGDAAYTRAESTASVVVAGYNGEEGGVYYNDIVQPRGLSDEVAIIDPGNVDDKKEAVAALRNVWIWWRELLIGLTIFAITGLIVFYYYSEIADN